jgi:hypothetical protein
LHVCPLIYIRLEIIEGTTFARLFSSSPSLNLPNPDGVVIEFSILRFAVSKDSFAFICAGLEESGALKPKEEGYMIACFREAQEFLSERGIGCFLRDIDLPVDWQIVSPPKHHSIVDLYCLSNDAHQDLSYFCPISGDISHSIKLQNLQQTLQSHFWFCKECIFGDAIERSGNRLLPVGRVNRHLRVDSTVFSTSLDGYNEIEHGVTIKNV